MTGQERKIMISDLPASVTFRGLWTIGYQDADGRKTSVKVSLDEIQTAYDKMLAATDKAGKAADRLNALSDHRDEIRDGYWWRWNEETGEWYNTGEIAKGNVMYATFYIDPATSILTMLTDEEYTGANFVLENGILSVEI